MQRYSHLTQHECLLHIWCIHRVSSSLSTEHLRDAVDRWQMVTPVRTSESGQPYPHHAHYLPRTAPAPDSAPDSAAQPQLMFYSIVAFGEQLRVRLQGRTTFIADDLHTRHVGDNETWLAGGEDGRTAGRHCFWTGSVAGDPRSTVSLSVCHGLVSPPSLPHRGSVTATNAMKLPSYPFCF